MKATPQYVKTWRENNKEATSRYNRTYYLKNKARIQERSREYHKKNYNLVQSRIDDLKHKYGLTLEQYQELIKKQKGRCLICRRSFLAKDRKYHVIDHCHKTRMVRGILCRNCNHGLGIFKTAANLERALEYLKSLEIFGSEG